MSPTNNEDRDPNFVLKEENTSETEDDIEEVVGEKEEDSDDLNLNKTKNVAAAFVAKLQFHKRNMGRRKFNNFPISSEISFNINNDDLLVYCQHLENIHADVKE
ncbi:unnamed protein product [Psylliodes chrysocephalus]|uniref:Uncharacterized protein n=1 Tax=Psylliodes chrysocephalus TaxID=3402493 RepID=A0A9P0D0V6_9CUCU|nr:unnamed protein product [Psylliodes chrysocephala]